jgi:hypothetical protein
LLDHSGWPSVFLYQAGFHGAYELLKLIKISRIVILAAAHKSPFILSGFPISAIRLPEQSKLRLFEMKPDDCPPIFRFCSRLLSPCRIRDTHAYA